MPYLDFNETLALINKVLLSADRFDGKPLSYQRQIVATAFA